MTTHIESISTSNTSSIWKRFKLSSTMVLAGAALTIAAVAGVHDLNSVQSAARAVAPAAPFVVLPWTHTPATLTVFLVRDEAQRQTVLAAQEEAARERDAVGQTSVGIKYDTLLAGPAYEDSANDALNEMMVANSIDGTEIRIVDMRQR